jgi:hypothetical protein
MRRTIIADKTSPVKTEHHREVLKTHIMDDLVVRPL